MSKVSAGLLLYRWRQGELEVLLVHPGGPFFRNKDAAAWSIPKGEIESGEEPLVAALREFAEEIGPAPDGPYLELGCIKQKCGKTVHAWAVAGDCDTASIVSNRFTIEWPPRSGRQTEFPEIDRAEFFPLHMARSKINPAQQALLDELLRQLERGQDQR